VSLLEIEDLTVSFPGKGGWVNAVEGATFSIDSGQTVGLVGESGSGKTVASLAILGLVQGQGGRVTGQARFEGRNLVGLSEKELSDIRGARASMIFQQAIRTLDPAFTVGEQIAETVRRHKDVTRKEAWAHAVEMLDRVKIPKAAQRASEYPHTFSGGMCQRVMIAMALCCEPSLLIADEPTTALDVTVQSHILELIREFQRDTGIAVLFISHDLGVIAEMTERVVVMYAAQVVEQATVEDIFVRPRHPYTSGLLGAIPAVGQGRRLVDIPGNVPAPGYAPRGCRFHPRCPHAEAGRCDVVEPPLDHLGSVDVRCIRAAELQLPGIVMPESAPR
jgi:peptide/nickel transport system ATP-binding protein/oligopeptide transport system ATP-binding protein